MVPVSGPSIWRLIMKSFLLLILSIITLLIAQTDQQYVEIKTLDGNTFVGAVIHEDENVIILKSVSGAEYTIPKEQIESREIADDILIRGKSVQRTDPNYTKYFLSPNAFALKKRSKYCSNKCLFFPSLTYAFTDQISAHGGILLFPGMVQVPYYFLVKATLFEKKGSAMAVGVENFSVTEQDLGVGLGVLFTTLTLGSHPGNISFSLMYGYTRYDSDWELGNSPTLVIAGKKQLNDRIALVSENYRFPNGSVLISAGPRYTADYLTIDFALVTVSDWINDTDGFPFFPYVGFTYHFKNH